MSPAERAQLRLQQLAARLEPSLREAFLRLVGSLAPDDLGELVRLLEAGDINGAVRFLVGQPTAAAAIVALRSTYAQGLIRLVQAVAKDVGGELRLVVSAPVLSPDLVAAVRRWEDQAFRRVLADVRAGLRETIAGELARGIGPRQIAVALKADIAAGGLTAYDAQIIASFRAALEEGRTGDALRRALRDRRYDKALTGRPLTPAEIDRMVDAYRRKLTAFRAETFARTAAIQAANEASAIGWRAAIAQGAVPATEVRRFWVVAQDERLCPVCAPVPEQNPGGVGLDDAFSTPNGPAFAPPLHPNCVLGSTPITATPAIRAVTQRHFEGTVVVIETAGGKHLSCTENHPILTTAGWVAAGALDVGRDVVCYLGTDRVPSVGDDHQDVPPRIEQIAEAFGSAPGMAPVEVPVSAEHFHGDGAGSEVAVVWANGELRSGVDPSFREQSREQAFAVAHVGLSDLLCASCSAPLLETGDATEGRTVGRGHLLSPVLGVGDPSPLSQFGFSPPAGLDAASPKPKINDVSRDTEGGGNLVDRIPAGVAIDDGVHVERQSVRFSSSVAPSNGNAMTLEESHEARMQDAALARELAGGLAGEVTTDQIVGIRRIEWSGHVFNLETEDGWYAAAGIITHNCRCTTWIRRVRPGVRQLSAPGTTRLVLPRTA